MTWYENQIPNLEGKIVIVTGANSGIGFGNVLQFDKNGATVVLACRNLRKGKKALSKAKSNVPSGDFRLMHLD